MRLRGLWATVLFVHGCASIEHAPPEAQHPALRMPAHAPPPPEPPKPATAELSSDARPEASPPRHGYLPDPPALSQRGQWRHQLVYDRGVISVGAVEFECLATPRPTARRLGRFALELWVGFELVERVRFDFPLLAAEEPAPGPRRSIHEVPRFAPGARVSLTVWVPASQRATRAQILDRASGETIPISWPPEPGAGSPPSADCAAAPPSTTGNAKRSGASDKTSP
jgi:hypothetical protein